MVERKHYKTIVISDIHMGYRQSQAGLVNEFLKSVDCDTLILNGDILDGWRLRKSGDRKWRPEYTKFLKIIMKMMENKGTSVIYVVGNHDAFFDHVVPFTFSNIRIVRDYIFDSGSHRVFVTHGDIFDSISSNVKWLAKLGDLGYRILLSINQWYNWYRRKRGKPAKSFSHTIKKKVKNAVASSTLDDMMADVAKAHKCDMIICGHTHQADDRYIYGIRYLNSGDWIESRTALLEDDGGNWLLIKYNGSSEEMLSGGIKVQ